MTMRVRVVIGFNFDGWVNNDPWWSHFHFRSSNGTCGENKYGTDKQYQFALHGYVFLHYPYLRGDLAITIRILCAYRCVKLVR
jgi:hypothetical protein